MSIDAEFREMAEAAIKYVNKRIREQPLKVAKPKYPHYKPLYKMLINGGWKVRGKAVKLKMRGE